MFAPRAYSSTNVRTVNPTLDRRRRRRIAEMVTATAPETIIMRIPVAYAPACALTSALKTSVMMMQTPVKTRTTGRTARLHSGAIP
jgi:hypothetical protein